MFYHYVWVRSNRYHGSEPLTYASDQRLATGQIVRVALQKEHVLGVVSGVTSKPRFQTKPIDAVLDVPPLPNHLLKLAEWMLEYYPAPLGIMTQQLIPATFSETSLHHPVAHDLSAPDYSQLPPLTDEQTAALEQMQSTDTYIVHGRTGSGKTRLYIECAEQAIERGESVIILTPEISLTGQLAANVRAVFDDRVVVMHSNQSPNERQQAWLRCLRSEEPLVVIGPRSALFSPLAKIGLVIIDESHEAAYKQEQSPQYLTGRVAAMLATIARCSLILGSATPSIADYYIAKQKQKPIILLEQLAQQNNEQSTNVAIIDRTDKSRFTRSTLLSNDLIAAIEHALQNGEQSLIYLNRRGTARIILCNKCGWQASCPHCDLPLTYHGDDHKLRCHSCNFAQSAVSSCPECGNIEVIYKSAGTKAAADEVQRLFPEARVARFDTDNLKADRFEQQYEGIKDGAIDILVGTQLLAKGLDLPKLSTLGVVLADTSLYMPDFSAHERTFQLLTQVIGRVGRGHRSGTAIIQTYHPDNPIIQAAIAADYESFYESELASRQQFDFPPFVHLLKLTIRRATLKSTQQAAEDIRESILSHRYKVRIEGPAPSFYEKLQNKYQWQLIVKARDRSELLKVIAELPANVSYDIDPMDLL